MRIKTKIVLMVFVMVVLVVGAMTALVYRQAKQNSETSYEQVARGQLQRIDAYIVLLFDDFGRSVRTLASADVTREAIPTLPNYLQKKEDTTTLNAADQSPQVQALIQYGLQLIDMQPLFLNFVVSSAEGGMLIQPFAKRSAGYDPRTRGWYKGTVETSKPFTISKAYTTTYGEILCSIGAKVMGTTGSVIGVATNDVSLQTLVKLTSGIKVGQSGYIMLVEDTGTILSDPKFKDAVFKNVKDAHPALAAALQKPNTVQAIELQGQPALVTSLQGGLGWHVVLVSDPAELNAASDAMTRAILLAGLGIAVLAMIGALLFARSITKPIDALVIGAERVSENDFAAVPPRTMFSGDMLILYDSIDRMVKKLTALVKTAEEKIREAEQQAENARQAVLETERVRAAAETSIRDGIIEAANLLEKEVAAIAGTATNLSDLIVSSEHGAVEQEARMATTVYVVDSMNSSVVDVARKASHATDVSRQTRTLAEEGEAVVGQAVRSIGDVQRDSMALKSGMGVLAEHATAISQIMGVISDIADQTNLLALNAAIEAARAGDAGRGFAVVADEVRKLAEKTMQSTTDVGNAIRAIQHSVDSSIKQVDATVVNVERATELSTKSGEALGKIVQMAETSAEQVTGIAAASEEQAHSTIEISAAVGQVSSIADQNASAMHAAAAAVVQLSAHAAALSNLIRDMQRK